MLNSETKRKINSARDILVGKVTNPIAQVDQITNALIYKFMDDMDQENIEVDLKQQFFVGDYAQYSWSKLLDKKLSGQERFNLYEEATKKMALNKNIPQLFRNIFKDARLPYNDPRVLSLFLKEINEFSYSHSEELGNAFEYLLSILGSQGDAGMFRTPRHIIDFITEVVDPKKNETILDSACGTAGFLISAYKHILKNHDGLDNKIGKPTNKETNLTPDEKTKLMNNISGYDISDEMVKLSLVNMFLHGFQNPNIFVYDTLSSEKRWGEQFDVIMANPSFMTPKGGIKPHKKFSIQANRAEVLFVDYIMEHLSIKGRAGIIVPEGVIFKGDKAYKALRKKLVEDGLFAVVSLPAGVFKPYSGVKTSILLFDNQVAKKTNEMLFIKVENDGFDLGAQRREIDKNDLPKAVEILEIWKTGKKKKSDIALWVKKEKIIEIGDYNLTGERYREVEVYKNVKWEMVELGEICEILNGYAFKSKNYTENGIRIIRITNVQKGKIVDNNSKFYPVDTSESISRYGLRENDILLSLTGNVGRIGILRKELLPASLNQRVACLRVDENKILTKYFFYILNQGNFENDCIKSASGIAQKNLSTVWLEKYKIPLPPLEVQKEIVEQIEVKQNAINHAREIIKNLERERRYFGQELRKLEDVEMVELGEVGKISMCKRIFKNQTTNKGDIPFYKMGTFGKQPDAYISRELFEDYRKKYSYPKKGDILLSTFGTIGRTVVFDGNPAYFQDSNIVWIDNDQKLITNEFLHLVYQSIDWETTKGGTIERLYNKLIEKTKTPLPPLATQKQLVAEAQKEEEILTANKNLIEIMVRKIEKVITEI